MQWIYQYSQYNHCVGVHTLLASRELQRKLEAVRFPGYSGDEDVEGESDGELAAIDVFSESGSEVDRNSVDGQ